MSALDEKASESQGKQPIFAKVCTGPRGVLELCNATERGGSRPGLQASCLTCGAPASDWRHLLGVGASVVVCAADSQGMLLTYPGACGECGASKLLVERRPARERSVAT